MAQIPPRPTASRSGGAANGGSGSGSGQRTKSDDKQPGTFFLGRYRVVDEIGVGGMASVHLARMDGPGGFQKWVAIKRIHPHLVEDDQFVDMFLDEARIAAGINHANVAQVFDLGKDENTYWIAMEYLHGEPLREVMRRAEDRRAIVTPELAARICSDAAEGLHAAHELRNKNGQLLGLVHRDVTPHNLFLTYDGYTKVVDFGIAKVADRLSSTRAGTLKGKLAYMSPEQVRGAEVDRTTDIFALGVVLWELTTSQRLFRMNTDLDTLEKVQACVVPPPSSLVPDYPVELESVVMKALAKRKQDRFQTAREFSRSLQNFLMRRGAFVGPEEVAQFVRQVFSDRIQKREAHLAWAAEVTSTINVDQLRAGQAVLPGSAEDLSLVSYDSQGQKKPRRAAGAAPPMGPTSLPQPALAPGAAAVRPTGPTMPAAGVAQAQAQGAQAQMSAASLMDDDEDVPTTVATRNDHEGSGRPAAPRPAAGMPAMPVMVTTPYPGQYGQAAAYSSGAFPAHAAGDERTAALPSGMYPAGGSGLADLGSTIAMPNNQQMQQQQQAERMRVQAQQHQQQYQQFYQQQPGFNGQGQQPYYPQQGAPGGFPPGQGPTAQFAALPMQQMAPQSQIETALSLPRPDPAAVWLAQQEEAARRPQKRNTGVLAAVVILTALCVTGIGALVYFKMKAPGPVTTTNTTATAEVPAPPPPMPTPTETVVPAQPIITPPSATATVSAAPTTQPKVPPTNTSSPVPPATPKEPVASTPKEAPTQEPTSAPEKEEPGFLTIVCNPFCDDILDGGRSLGPSPVVHVGVKPGQHRITLKRKDFPTKVISVIVVSGQVTTQRVNMK